MRLFASTRIVLPRIALKLMLVISVLAIEATGGQTGASPAASPLLLKSTTRLVQLSVVAKNRDGRPVTDLTKDDFRLYDNGKEQKIAFFQAESSSILPSTQAPLPENTFTNHLEQHAGVPSAVTVILLDALNTRLTDQAYARKQVLEFLQTIEPDDRIGLYTLGAGLRVLHDYTTDSRDLLAKLAQYRGQVLPDTVSVEGGPEGLDLSGFMGIRGASGAERDFYTADRVLGTLRALEFIADHLSAIPGRKNLIWVSGGFPLQINFDNIAAWKDPSRDQRSFALDVDQTVRALNDANIAMYPVDARGLMVSRQFTAERAGSARPRPANLNSLHAPIGSKNQDTMIELASRTGGRAYYNTNDLNHAIRDAVSDSTFTYTVGFYPDAGHQDGKFHKLTLKSDREGLNVRYRKGYFDLPPSPQEDKERKVELADAVFSPLEATSIPLTAQLKSSDRPGIWDVSVRVDRNAVNLEPENGRWAGKLDVLFVQKNDRGSQFNGVDNTLNLNLKQETYDRVLTEGIVFHQAVERNALASQLRIVVRDAASGNVGSVTVPFAELKGQ